MEARAMLPVGPPQENPTESYWQNPPDELASFKSPSFPEQADIVIIGSGITGAGVAWNLLNLQQQPDDQLQSIAMIEARQACSGATGRNGGHTKAASYRTFQGHVEKFGLDVSCQIARLELANIRAVHAFAFQHGIDCESRPCATVDVFFDKMQWKQAHDAIHAMQTSMPGDDASEYRFVTPAQLHDEYHVDEEGVCGGIVYEAGSISAYKFTIGVLKLCLAKGLNLQTNTPALSVSKNPSPHDAYGWLIETNSGPIKAKRVILATNGYTASINTRFQGIIVPTRGQVTAHRPGSRMPSQGLPVTYSFVYEHGFDYMVSKPFGTCHSGNVIFGGGLVKAPENGLSEYGTTDDTALHPSISDYLRNATPRYFGPGWGQDHVEGRIRKEWSGVMGFSPDGLPFVGPMPGEEGIWVAASFQGHGMAFCWLCANALAVMVRQGTPSVDLSAVPWFPNSFLITESRLRQRFHGAKHTTVVGSAE